MKKTFENFFGMFIKINYTITLYFWGYFLETILAALGIFSSIHWGIPSAIALRNTSVILFKLVQLLFWKILFTLFHWKFYSFESFSHIFFLEIQTFSINWDKNWILKNNIKELLAKFSKDLAQVIFKTILEQNVDAI